MIVTDTERLKQIVPALLMVAAVVATGATALRVGSIVVQSFDDPRVMHEYLEGTALMSIDAWRDGGLRAMYPANYSDSTLPLILTSYPPLFHAAWRVASWATNDNTYAPGRVVALLTAIGVLACIYGIARSAGVSRVAATVFSLAFLMPVPVARWIGVARVDVPALALTLAGLWVYVRLERRRDWSFLWCAVPFFLAGLTKQSMVAAPAAVLAAELANRRYKHAGVFGAVTAGSVLLVFLALNAVTQGGFFDGTVTSLASEFFFVAGASMAADLLISNPVPLILTLLTVSLWVLRDHENKVTLFYAGTAFAVLALTIGKPGANINYYLEPVAALCIAGAAGYAGLERRGWKTHAVVATSVTVAAVWGALQVAPGLTIFHRYKDLILRESGRIELPADPLGRPILAPSSIVLLFEPERPYYLNDDYTFSVLAAWDKLIPPERIPDDLRAHRIGAVVVDRNVLTPTMEPAFIGDWQGGWNFWSVASFREALLQSYVQSDVDLPLQLLLFLPKETPSDSGGGAVSGPVP